MYMHTYHSISHIMRQTELLKCREKIKEEKREILDPRPSGGTRRGLSGLGWRQAGGVLAGEERGGGWGGKKG